MIMGNRNVRDAPGTFARARAWQAGRVPTGRRTTRRGPRSAQLAVTAVVLTVTIAAAGCSSSGPRDNETPPTTTTTASLTTVATPGSTSLALGSATPGTFTVGPGASTPTTPIPTTPRTPAPLTPAQARCTAVVMASLSPTERAGQVLMVGVPAGSATSVTKTVTGYAVGGIFLRGRSTISASSLRQQLAAVQAASRRTTGVALHVAVDQEGGKVQTLSGKGFVALPTARTQGSWTTSALRARITASAKALRAAGITVNLAPVADTVAVADIPRNPPIGKVAREYGHTPSAVAADVTTVVAASRAAGLGTAAKHFPGLGRVRANTDYSSSAVDAVTTAKDPNLAPFAAAITAGTPMVMIASATYPRLDSQRIAAFSPAIVTTLLRGTMKFPGVAISDDLGAAKALAAVPVGTRAAAFIGAGGDLVLTVRADQAPAMRKALLAQAARSASFTRRLDQAAGRVVASKVAAGLVSCTPAQLAGATD